MNEYKFVDISIGMKASFSRTMTKAMEDSFRIISGDENLLHQNDNFAKEISKGKFREHIVFGMLTASLYSTMAGMYLPGKYSLIHSVDELSFINPVYIGDRLIVEGEVTDKDENLGLIRLKVRIMNQNNKLVSRAKMKVLVTK